MNFYKSFTFIISFMVLLVFMQMFFGDKFVNKFLWLVLASMVVFNADTLKELTKGLSGPTSNVKTDKNGNVIGGGGSTGGAGASRTF